MNIHFKLTTRQLQKVLSDLQRPHPHAAERLGFLGCRVSQSTDSLLILGASYIAVPDIGMLRTTTLVVFLMLKRCGLRCSSR